MADLLVVDDDSDLAETLGEILRQSGHAVRIGGDGAEGARLVAEQRPDLVLLDVDMPVLGGPDMAWLLFLRDCGDEDVPVLLLSGTPGLADVAAQAGTPYFLPKPYETEAVLALIARALSERIAPRPKPRSS